MTTVTIEKNEIFVVRTNRDGSKEIEIYGRPEEGRINLAITQAYEDGGFNVTGEDLLESESTTPRDIAAIISFGMFLKNFMARVLENQANADPPIFEKTQIEEIEGQLPRITPAFCLVCHYISKDGVEKSVPCFSVKALAENLGISPELADEMGPDPSDDRRTTLLRMYAGSHSFVKPPKTSWLDDLFK